MEPDVGQPVLRVQDLTRSYGLFSRTQAVRGVSFTVNRGEIFGLIGPDGGGKTSIIQSLAGVLRTAKGRVSVEGLDVAVHGERVKRRVGYMPQGLGSNLYESLTVDENIEFFRDLRQLDPAIYRSNRTELLAATRLAPFLDRRAGQLSGGMRQKLALVCTLIHLPDVLLLDEPTTGVDPISRQEFWLIIRRIVEARQTTVLLSTSYMDEAERCHRIALLHEGRIVADGHPDEVRRRATGRFARVTVEPQPRALQILRAHPRVTSTEVFGDDIHVQFDGSLRDIEASLARERLTIHDVSLEEPRLEDVFLQLTGANRPSSVAARFERPGPSATSTSIECRSVTRRFDSFTAVDAVDLSVRPGEVFGLLGPNGAGKTTLIKMMCGLLEPSAGTITIGGVDVRRNRERVWTAVGYMSQRFSLYPDLSVRQNLRLYADLYSIDRTRYAGLMAHLGLEPFAGRLTRDLPSGVRQRLSLLCAVLHHPQIVFLDEPTSGVDPQARRVFWALIYALSRESRVTVVVSTHYMDEATHCDRLGLMDQGRFVAIGSPAELKAESERRAGAVLAIEAPRGGDLSAVHRTLTAIHPDAVLYGDRIHIRSLDPDVERTALTARLERIVGGPIRIDRRPLSMDETFIDFIRAREPVHA